MPASRANIVIYCTVNHNSACRIFASSPSWVCDVCFWSLSQPFLVFLSHFITKKEKEIYCRWENRDWNDTAIIKKVNENDSCNHRQILPLQPFKLFSCLSPNIFVAFKWMQEICLVAIFSHSRHKDKKSVVTKERKIPTESRPLGIFS